jgi:hypothetical protein
MFLWAKNHSIRTALRARIEALLVGLAMCNVEGVSYEPTVDSRSFKIHGG